MLKRRYPIYNEFYNLIETFEKKVGGGKKDNDFIKFKLKKFIDFRNILFDQFTKMEKIVDSYKKRIEKENLTARVEKYKIKKSSKLEKHFQKNKRVRVMPIYENLINVIQYFDRKIRPYKEKRNSYKYYNNIKKEYYNKEIKFRVKTFKKQIKELIKTSEFINNHTQFFLYEYQKKFMFKKFNDVEYIKNY